MPIHPSPLLRLLARLLFMWGALVAGPAMAATQTDGAQGAPASEAAPAADQAPTAPAAAEPVDRITMARFARAFGRLSRDTPPEELLQEDSQGDTGPDEASLRRELNDSGLERRQWDRLIRRMREDEAFRERVGTLSASYRLGQ